MLKAALNKPGVAAFRLRERLKARQAGRGMRRTGSDGWPLPPPLMMIQTVGHTDPDRFERAGRACADLVRDWSVSAGQPIDGRGAILDFGCGCGRVLRHWHDLPGRVVGADYNPKLAAWADENLPFAEAVANTALPPLPFDDHSFDLVYAFSVFTHLDQPAQLAWIAELVRVIKPGGLALVTTKGDIHATEQLGHADLGRYQAGEPVVKAVRAEGTNHCAAYTPRPWVERVLLDGWGVVRHHPGLADVMDRQEIWLATPPAPARD